VFSQVYTFTTIGTDAISFIRVLAESLPISNASIVMKEITTISVASQMTEDHVSNSLLHKVVHHEITFSLSLEFCEVFTALVTSKSHIPIDRSFTMH
jgi:hypothetical protein